jgi:cysteine sulfinate desulfinase/cysteine desulfurase-like protein
VLQAMHIDPRVAHGEIRFSLGRFNTDADLDRLFDILPAAVAKVAASTGAPAA